MRLHPCSASMDERPGADRCFAFGDYDAYDEEDGMEEGAGDVAVEGGFTGTGGEGVDYYEWSGGVRGGGGDTQGELADDG